MLPLDSRPAGGFFFVEIFHLRDHAGDVGNALFEQIGLRPARKRGPVFPGCDLGRGGKIRRAQDLLVLAEQEFENIHEHGRSGFGRANLIDPQLFLVR